MLDAWAGQDVSDARAAYEEAFAEAQQARAALEAVQEACRADSAQLDEARFTLQRIDEINPTSEEYEEIIAELAARRKRRVAGAGGRCGLLRPRGRTGCHRVAERCAHAARKHARHGFVARRPVRIPDRCVLRHRRRRARRARLSRFDRPRPCGARTPAGAHGRRCRGSCAHTARACKTCWSAAPKPPNWFPRSTMPIERSSRPRVRSIRPSSGLPARPMRSTPLAAPPRRVSRSG